ncbi:YitT family protein [Lactococcus nasutitermitis]|uniref:YitT family protein n=1 Tax=Lactococcus nasutitermitis TaxID=1652957 RepID=A0ABV9JDG9_9LACT|nr:YitT family protein [Lactococcus nasutitermitis]
MKKFKEYSLIILGSLSIAISVSCLSIPNNLGEGGVPGLTAMGVYLFHIPAYFSNFLLNGLLIAFSYRYFNKNLIFRTIFVVLLSTLFLRLVVPIQFEIPYPVLAAILAGATMGGGIGLIYLGEATSASGSLVAKILEKKFQIRKSHGLLISDLSVIIPSSIFLGVERTLLTVISVYVSSKVLSLVIENNLAHIFSLPKSFLQHKKSNSQI